MGLGASALDTTRTAVFATLNPISAALLGVLLLGEPLTVSFVAGLVCALAGIVTANLSTRGPDQARA
jgi:drug/metabolite transporter (DMT)-like permease